MASMSEQAIIAMIRGMQPALADGFLGIGDDAAVLPGDPPWLISQDMLVDGIHFRSDWAPPELIGYKAAIVSLSDIAAMGGTPRAVLTSVAVPRSLSQSVLETLYAGLTTALGRYAVPIIGGDTVGTDGPLTLDVVILGTAAPIGPILRHTAQPGDRLMVSGWLGNSRAGLELMRQGARWPGRTDTEHSLLAAHLKPEARIDLGGRVAPLVRAMTDMSDGLYQELLELSPKAEIWLESLPISAAMRQTAQKSGVCAESWAVYGGEEFELLMAVPPEQVSAVRQAAQDIPVWEIGVVTGRGGLQWLDHGTPVSIEGAQEAFDHFRR